MDAFDRVIADLTAIHPDTAAALRRRPDAGSRAIALDELLDPRGRWMRSVVDGHPATALGHCDVAAADVCARVTEGLLWSLVAAVAVHGRGWSYADGSIQTDETGEPLVVLADAELAVAAHDPLLATVEPGRVPIVVLPRPDDVACWSAERIAPLLAAIVDGIRAAAPFGRRGLWAIVGNEVTFSALVAAHRTNGDDRAALATATAFLDQVALVAGAPIPRPPIHEVATAIGPRLAPTKAACCVRYKVLEPADDQLCRTCPLHPHDERPRRTQPWIELLCATATTR